MKIEIGKYYYYAKFKRKMLCVKVGKTLSWFTDYKKSKYQFYNEDMFPDKAYCKHKFFVWSENTDENGHNDGFVICANCRNRKSIINKRLNN
jgi:hypothetical protein